MRLTAIAIITCLVSSVAHAQEQDADQVARDLANPNSPLFSLRTKLTFGGFDGTVPGADGQSNFLVLFQPALPFALANGDKIFFRPALPYIASQPIPGTGGFDTTKGWGDLSFDLSYGRSYQNGMFWGAGTLVTVPTASNEYLGLGEWAAGPEVIFGRVSPKNVFGLKLTHQWDLSDDSDVPVNESSIQPIAAFLPGNGLNFGFSPQIFYDWTDDQWTVPFQFAAAKTVIMGKTPVKIGFEVNYFIEKPDDFSQDWTFALTFTPVIRNPFSGR